MSTQELEILTWTEKYRPTEYDEIKGHENITREIQIFLSQKIPINLLLVGAAGVGKTSLARIIAKQYINGEEQEHTDIEFMTFSSTKGNIYEFNASDDRGDEFVKGKIKEIIEGMGNDVIIIDEGEYLDEKAQPALRRLAEKAVLSGKMFIITANDDETIIPTIISRFKKIELRRLTDEIILKQILYILDKEEISYETQKKKTYIGEVVRNAYGDMRLATNNIMYSVINKELVISEDYVMYRDSVEKYFNILVKTVERGDFMAVRNDLISMIYEDKHGLLPTQMIRLTETWLKTKYDADEISSDKWVQYLVSLKECDDRLSRKTRKYIQLLGMIAEFRHISLRL